MTEHIELTEDHFNLFKDECERWVIKLGLIAWRRDYLFEDEDESFLAACHGNTGNMVATISLSTSIPSFPGCDQERIVLMIKETALHEMLELLIWPLMELAYSRSLDSHYWDKESHAVIRTLEFIMGDN